MFISSELYLSGYEPESRVADIGMLNNFSALRLLRNPGGVLICNVPVDDPFQPIGEHQDYFDQLPEELKRANFNLVLGPPQPIYPDGEPQRQVGVWDIGWSDSPDREKYSPQENKMNPLEAARQLLQDNYSEGRFPADVSRPRQRAIVETLIGLGLEELAVLNRNPMQDIPRLDLLTNDFQDPDNERVLLVAPTKEPHQNRGAISIWYHPNQENVIPEVEHLASGDAYSMETKPANIPVAEKRALAEVLIEQGFIPYIRHIGKRPKSNTLPNGLVSTESAREVRDLVSGLTEDRIVVAGHLSDIGEGRSVAGPAVVIDSKNDGRPFVCLGNSVSLWRTASGDTDLEKLLILKESLAKGWLTEKDRKA